MAGGERPVEAMEHAQEATHGRTPAAEAEASAPVARPRLCWVAGVVLLAALIAASRLPIALHLQTNLNQGLDDEITLTLTAVDHFLGIPVRELHWSGATNQMLLMPLLLADAAWQTRLHLSPESFVEYLADVYRAPWHVLWLARLLVIFVSSVGLASLFVPFAQRLKSAPAAAGAVLFLAFVPFAWDSSARAHAMGLALGLACLAFALAMSRRGGRGTTAWVGALLGLCLAARLVFVPVAPLLLAVRVGRTHRPVATTLAIGFWAAVGFLLACPFAWTEPIRFAKAVVGNVVKHGTPVGWWGAMRVFNDAVPVPLSVLGVVGVFVGAWRRKWGVLLGAALSVLLMVYPSSRAPLVETRYFLSMSLVILVTLVEVTPPLPWWRPGEGAAWRRWLAPALAAVAAVTVGFHARTIWRDATAERERSAPALEAADAVRRLPRDVGPVAVCDQLFGLVERSASSASLEAVAARYEAAIADGRRVLGFTKSFGFDPRVIRPLMHNFDEKEQSAAARLRAAAGAVDRPGLDLRPFGDELAPWGDGLSVRETIEKWRRGELAVVVLNTPPPPGVEPAAQFTAPGATDHFYLLRHDEPSSRPVGP